MISEHEYLFGKKKEENKVIDVMSKQDFPTLALGGGLQVNWSAPGQHSKTA
jgi:hypothetical protein